MGLRSLPFFKAKRGWQFAGGGQSDGGGGGGGGSLPIATTDTIGAVRVGNGLDVANDGTLSTSMQFSTSEFATGLKWIDGKDIYCSVLDNIPPSNSYRFSDPFTNSTLDKIIFSSFIFQINDGDGFVVTNGNVGSSNYSLTYEILIAGSYKNRLQYKTNAINGSLGHCTIFYTKA